MQKSLSAVATAFEEAAAAHSREKPLFAMAGISFAEKAAADVFAVCQHTIVCAKANDDGSFSAFRLIPLAEIDGIDFSMGVGCCEIHVSQKGVLHTLFRTGTGGTTACVEAIRCIRALLRDPENTPTFSVKETVCPKCKRPVPQASKTCPSCTDKEYVFRRFLSLVDLRYSLLLFSTLLFIVVSLMELVVPKIKQLLIDDYIQPTSGGNAELSLATLAWVVVLMAVSALAINILKIFRNNTFATVGNHAVINLRGKLYAKIQAMTLEGISERTAGELINRVTQDTAEISAFLSGTLPTLFEQLLILISVGTVMFIYDFRLALMILLPLPLVIVVFRLLWRFTHRLYHRQWSANADANTVLYDIFQGIRVVKVFGNEKREIEKYDAAAKKVADISVKNETVWSFIMPYANFLLGVGNFIVLYYVGNRILGGSMTIGDMTMFSAYTSLLYTPIRWAARLPRMLVRATTSMSKVFEILDEEPAIADKNNAVQKPIEGHVEIDNIVFGYNPYEDVLKGVSVSVKPGEMLGIVGPSGVGKSTLINLVMRLYDPREGAIRIDGIDLRDYSQETLRSQIGVVLQETFLFSGTLYENIAYARPGADRNEVIRASKLAGAHSFIMKLPDAYNTRIGEMGYTLSGGERQRIAIARAILHDPRILILDEATSALDTETEKSIQDAFAHLIKDRTTIAIAHRLSTLRNATKLLVLDRGKVAEIGTHEELMRNKGIYYGLVMAQRQMSRMSNQEETNN